eukprot:TRINITY_DN9696_c0_g1_i13.p1 TRINITY_DN9696_c0_g1~~TRINITY_DN9696_c0_g1_i13.p1  ORF type:complete len:259 (-),score=72.40 TRINITY_DN9696_c0_g1_i13:215-991(-)
MNKIYELSPYTGILKLQAGVILEDAERYCNKKGFVFPLDLGAKGSCQIGGNLGANAGGLHFLKYGSLHGNTVGLRAVLPSGRVLDTLHSHRKDNTGYDLKQLFIGAEGTLGIITDASVLCYPLPKSMSLCLLSVPSFKEVKEILIKTKRRFGERLSAFELMDDQSKELVRKHIPGNRDALNMEKSDFYVIIEIHHDGTQKEADDSLMAFMGTIEEHIKDGIFATDAGQTKEIWNLREKCADAFVQEGVVSFLLHTIDL